MSFLSDAISSIRSLILNESEIVSRLAVWNGVASVHTRSPLPDDSTFPLISVGPTEIGQNDNSLNSNRTLIVSNLYCYGYNPEHYRTTEEVGYLMKDLFHRNESFEIPGYSTIGLVAQGPSIASSEDETICGKLVTLSIRLLKTGI